jgi:hypothetical protein
VVEVGWSDVDVVGGGVWEVVVVGEGVAEVVEVGGGVDVGVGVEVGTGVLVPVGDGVDDIGGEVVVEGTEGEDDVDLGKVEVGGSEGEDDINSDNDDSDCEDLLLVDVEGGLKE